MVNFIIYSFVSFYVLWIFYLAVMSLFRANEAGTLTKVTKIFGYPILIVGTIIDFLVNLLCTFFFFDFPKERMLTKRLDRYLTKGTGWRYNLALWICNNLLNMFDPSGTHCKYKK